MKTPHHSHNTRSFSTIFQLSIYFCLLIGGAIQPNLHAAQRTEPDSTSVLAIKKFKVKINDSGRQEITNRVQNISYIAEGATVNLTLIDGREIEEATIDFISNDYIRIDGKQISFSAIQRIDLGTKNQRFVSQALGSFLLMFGVVSTLAVLGFAGAFGTAALLLLLLLWIPGGIGVNTLMRRYPRIHLDRPNISIGTKKVSRLIEKIRQRLSLDGFYVKRR